jgi:hypothetical protein
MVKYWKFKSAVRAKVTTAKDGSYIMWMDGEKYPFPGFPRGALLLGHTWDKVLDGGDPRYSIFCQTKHIIKNYIFNKSWELLEKNQDIIQRIKDEGLNKLGELVKDNKFEMLPPERLVPAVKEIYRTMTVIANEDKRIEDLRDILTFILQEDDSYRFRVQWLASYMPDIERGLNLMEQAEIISDMREKIKLLRRVLLELLKDKTIKNLYDKFCKECNWKKVKLTKADKYYFRAKYFRVDYPDYSY